MPKKKSHVERILLFSDTHFSSKDGVHPVWEMFKNFAEGFKPDRTIDLGDIASWGVISRFNKSKFRHLEGRRIREELDFINERLDEVENFSPNHVLLEGNHDVWLEEYIDQHPELEGMLEYEHTLMEGRKSTFIPLQEQPYWVDQIAFLHGWFSGKNAPKRHLETIDSNLFHGHVHKPSVEYKVSMSRGLIQAWSIPCLTTTRPEYNRAKPTDHVQGFMILYRDPENNQISPYPVLVQNGYFLYGVNRFTKKELIHELK
jgi:predicted phosphodiesterase